MASFAEILRRVCALLSFVTMVSATCYRPDGVAIDAAYQPCNGSIPVSMCCHLGVGNNNGDACGSGSSYGLCGITGTQLWRESCTDQTWTSPLCLKLCINNGPGDQMITACSDGSYCCGSNNASCCDAGQGQFIVNNAVSNTSAAVGSSTSSSAASSTYSLPISASSLAASQTTPTSVTTQSSNTSTSTQNTFTSVAATSNGLSFPVTIGLSVGISIVVIAIASFAGIFFWSRQRKAKRFQAMTEGEGLGIQDDKGFKAVTKAGANYSCELGYENMPLEADGRASHGVEIDDGGTVMGYGLPSRAAELPASNGWKK